MSRKRKPSPFDRLAQLQKEGKLDAVLAPLPPKAAPAAPAAPVTPESEADALRRAMAGVKPLGAREARVARAPAPKPAAPLPAPAGTDQELLARAFAGVKPLDDKERARRAAAEAPGEAAASATRARDAAAAEARRAAAAGGDAAAAAAAVAGAHRAGTAAGAVAGPAAAGVTLLQMTDDTTGVAPGVDARTLRQLRSGDDLPATPPPRAVVDLHGLRAAEVDATLRRVVARARAAALRVLLVITGRGLGSEGGVPVVRGAAVECLVRLPEVLAFTPAQPRHGGPGALYVLLRKPRA